MNANYNRDSDLKKVFMFGLILEKGTFKYVKNGKQNQTMLIVEISLLH